MRYTLIKGGVAVNVIEASEAFCQSLVAAGEADSFTTEDVAFAAQPVYVFTKLSFLNRFTVQERCAIRATSKSDPIVEDLLHMLDNAETVTVTDALTVQGVGYLELQGIIAQGRSAELLAPG